MESQLDNSKQIRPLSVAVAYIISFSMGKKHNKKIKPTHIMCVGVSYQCNCRDEINTQMDAGTFTQLNVSFGRFQVCKCTHPFLATSAGLILFYCLLMRPHYIVTKIKVPNNSWCNSFKLF